MRTWHVPKDEALPLNLADLDSHDLCEWLGAIRISRYSRLRAALAFFKNRTNMRKFWKQNLSSFELGRDCRAAVNPLSYVVEIPDTGKKRSYGDPRYFCFMGFSIPDLGMEVICHESVHAGFCYAKRVNGRYDHFTEFSGIDEEAVCYPAGRIAREINRLAHDEGFYS